MTNETNHEQSSSAENCTTTISPDELAHFDEIIQPTVIEHNPSLTGLARLNPGIVYKEIDGEKLMMDVLQPQVCPTASILTSRPSSSFKALLSKPQTAIMKSLSWPNSHAEAL